MTVINLFTFRFPLLPSGVSRGVDGVAFEVEGGGGGIGGGDDDHAPSRTGAKIEMSTKFGLAFVTAVSSDLRACCRSVALDSLKRISSSLKPWKSESS